MLHKSILWNIVSHTFQNNEVSNFLSFGFTINISIVISDSIKSLALSMHLVLKVESLLIGFSSLVNKKILLYPTFFGLYENKINNTYLTRTHEKINVDKSTELHEYLPFLYNVQMIFQTPVYPLLQLIPPTVHSSLPIKFSISLILFASGISISL
jgi:hypothetical protein